MKASFETRQDGDRYHGTLTLLDMNGLEPETVCFSLAMPLDVLTLEGGDLIERQGDWHRVQLPPVQGNVIVLNFQGNGRLPKGTDFPYGLYIENRSGRIDVELDGPKQYASQARVDPLVSELCFIPDVSHTRGEAMFPCPVSLCFETDEWDQQWCERLLSRIDKPKQRVSVVKADADFKAIALNKPDLAHAFQLTVSHTGASLEYQTPAGFFQGQAFLMQYLIQWSVYGELPECCLADSAAFEYRGVHLDVVRHFFDAQTIAQWWDVLALFQFNAFHWHLTDDDGWRVPSHAFPELAKTGAWRGPDEALPPQMGTGSLPYGGAYSETDIQELVRQLSCKGVEVVPELDLPGHARALLKSVPEMVEADDASEYYGVQHYSDNVINPYFGQTLSSLKTLVQEWCALFPGRLFHLGCDEVPKGAWQASPSVTEAIDSGLPGPLHHLIDGIGSVVRSNGKSLAGWEEIADGAPPKDTWVYSWQGVAAGQKAAEKGHPVVMTPAQHCYLDLAVTPDADDPGYWWAGTVDLRQVYEYQPLSGLSKSAASRIKGVQYCLWTELVDTPQKAEFMWFPRLLAGSEVVWGSNTNMTYEAFESRAETWSQMLLRLGVAVRSKKMKW